MFKIVLFSGRRNIDSLNLFNVEVNAYCHRKLRIYELWTIMCDKRSKWCCSPPHLSPTVNYSTLYLWPCMTNTDRHMAGVNTHHSLGNNVASDFRCPNPSNVNIICISLYSHRFSAHPYTKASSAFHQLSLAYFVLCLWCKNHLADHMEGD